MNKQYDTIIIGAGIIGAAIAFELAKKGYKTLNVDKLPSAGHGSTSGSCAIIRLHYSTPDGVAAGSPWSTSSSCRSSEQLCRCSASCSALGVLVTRTVTPQSRRI